MTPKEQLESILSNKYKSEDGDLYKVELLDGMTDSEIENIKVSFRVTPYPLKLKNY